MGGKRGASVTVPAMPLSSGSVVGARPGARRVRPSLSRRPCALLGAEDAVSLLNSRHSTAGTLAGACVGRQAGIAMLPVDVNDEPQIGIPVWYMLRLTPVRIAIVQQSGANARQHMRSSPM